jgi:hypothetical protein
MILQILAFQIVKITGVSHQHSARKNLFWLMILEVDWIHCFEIWLRQRHQGKRWRKAAYLMAGRKERQNIHFKSCPQ